MMILSLVLLATVSSLISPTESFAPRSIVVDRSAISDNEAQKSFYSVERMGPLCVSLTDSVTGTQPQETTVAAVPKVAQRWKKSTKQLATLGPSSGDKEMIEKLFLAGADCFRLNFSHGSQEQKKELLIAIREIEEKYSHPIGILGDLQGPKLRVGEFSNPDGELLEAGQKFRLDLDTALGDNTRVNLPHPEIIGASEVGHELMVDDGKVKLTVIENGDDYLICDVDVP